MPAPVTLSASQGTARLSFLPSPRQHHGLPAGRDRAG